MGVKSKSPPTPTIKEKYTRAKASKNVFPRPPKLGLIQRNSSESETFLGNNVNNPGCETLIRTFGLWPKSCLYGTN